MISRLVSVPLISASVVLTRGASAETVTVSLIDGSSVKFCTVVVLSWIGTFCLTMVPNPDSSACTR